MGFGKHFVLTGKLMEVGVARQGDGCGMTMADSVDRDLIAYIDRATLHGLVDMQRYQRAMLAYALARQSRGEDTAEIARRAGFEVHEIAAAINEGAQWWGVIAESRKEAAARGAEESRLREERASRAIAATQAARKRQHDQARREAAARRAILKRQEQVAVAERAAGVIRDPGGRPRGVWQHWTPERQFSETKQKCLTSVLG